MQFNITDTLSAFADDIYMHNFKIISEHFTEMVLDIGNENRKYEKGICVVSTLNFIHFKQSQHLQMIFKQVGSSGVTQTKEKIDFSAVST